MDPSPAAASPGGAEELVERLKNALRKQGDFPVSARIVKDITTLTRDPKTTAHQLSEIILREPTLGMRVLNVVNSSFYMRQKPIVTVSQAVIQIGMKPLADLCANLVLLQRFVPAARQGGAFAVCLRRTVVTSLVSTLVSTELQSRTPGRKNETGHLFGLFSEIGELLLAFYFPRVYEAAVKRADLKGIPRSEGLLQITGVTSVGLSLEVLRALELPDYYAAVIDAVGRTPPGGPVTPGPDPDVNEAAAVLVAARGIAASLRAGCSKEDVDAAVRTAAPVVGLSEPAVASLLRRLPDAFTEYCGSVDLVLPPLPRFLSDLAGDPDHDDRCARPEGNGAFARHLQELREAVDAREPVSAVLASAMETLAWGLGFDRVLLLLRGDGKNRLVGKMALGDMRGVDPSAVRRDASDPACTGADARAFRDGRPASGGEPVLPGGTDPVAVPVGAGGRVVGVIYADRLPGAAGATRRPAAGEAETTAVAELLDRAVSLGRG